MNKLYVLNHKMNLQYEELEIYLKKLNELSTKNQIILSPSTLYLDYCRKNTKYHLCAQNAYYQEKGAYTGEVSFKQLKSLNIKYAIIGHSERRNIFKESDEIINEKVKSCIQNGIIPIICIGESKEERNNNNHLTKIEKQITSSLEQTTPKEVIIAYEPIWSIGTGTIPEKEELTQMLEYIHNILTTNYNIEFKILYGGSVDDTNIEQILKINYIDGVLIGGASLKIDVLKNIINK